MKIAVDAMGGDHAPSVVLEGAYQAAKLYSDIELILVGDEKVLHDTLKAFSWTFPSSVHIHHAPEVVHMHESPVAALRKKKQSSVMVAADLVKQGQAQSLVTAGHTGAAVAATTLKWRMLKGVDRPGIALPIPNMNDVSVLLDVGANVQCKAVHYQQYAVMGKIYAETILSKKNPRIGLLNVGEEDSKGHDEIKEVFQMLKKMPLNFMGNVEGRDIFNGRCDVIVCDGFVGNVVLKVSEGAVSVIAELAKREFKRNPLTLLAALLSKPVFSRLKKKIDYSEYGGAPLLGVDGTCIISHGSSNAKAICNAIRVARDFVNYRVNEHIVREMESYDPVQA